MRLFSLFILLSLFINTSFSYSQINNYENLISANTFSTSKNLIIPIPIFSRGDEFYVDGPLWYDGTARIEQFNSNEMRINIVMNVPSVGIPYQIKNGQINVTIKFFKNPKYNLLLSDINRGKNFTVPGVRLEMGKIAGGWFTAEKEYAKIIASNQHYLFTIDSPQVITISTNTIPGTLRLTKK